jgi:hypothetical protein
MSDFDTLMFDWLGNTFATVLVFNFLLAGPASFSTGHGLALTWRPWQQLIFYSALLAAAVRFFDYALANGDLISSGGFALAWGVQLAISGFAYRLTRVRQMIGQYPWLYARKGLLGWEARH